MNVLTAIAITLPVGIVAGILLSHYFPQMRVWLARKIGG